MKKAVLRREVQTAVFTALICAATLSVRIPMSITSGYVNVGDCFVLAAAWMLGPWYGLFAGGVGSALADLIGGYPHYVLGTLLIKGTLALVAALLGGGLRKHAPRRRGRLLGAVAAETVMVVGYFLYVWLLLGNGASAALTSVPPNLVQGAVGIVGGMALTEVLGRLPAVGRR